MIQDDVVKNYIVSQNKTIKPINAKTLFETSENESLLFDSGIENGICVYKYQHTI